jgi:hypothetical protein
LSRPITSSGISIEARAGDSDHLDPTQLQLLLPQSVALEGRMTAMGLVDVEFDREAQLRPIHVEHKAVDGGVRRWGRQARPADSGQEAALELGEGQISREIDAEGASEGSDAVMATGASQERLDCAEVEEAALLGEVEESFEMPRRGGGDIEKSARQCGDRNAVDKGAIDRLEYLGVMDASRQAGPSAHRAGGVERCRTPLGDPPKPSCGEMAEQCIGSAGEGCGQAMSMDRQLRVTDGVDTPVQTVEAAGGSSSRDSALGVAERSDQLTDRDDAVLTLGQRSKSMVVAPTLRARSSFLLHIEQKGDSGRFSPPPPGALSTFLPEGG